MKKASIKILSYFLLTAAGIAIGGGGSYAVQLLTQPDAMAVVEIASVEPQADMDTVQLRVRNGQMEWFDGVRWNTAAAVADLKQNDPAEAESDAWDTLVQQRGAAREAQRQEALAQFDREQTDLTVGEKPVVHQQTTTRQPSATTTTPTQLRHPAVAKRQRHRRHRLKRKLPQVGEIAAGILKVMTLGLMIIYSAVCLHS